MAATEPKLFQIDSSYGQSFKICVFPYGFREEKSRAPQAKILGVSDVTEAIFVKDYVILDHQILKISAAHDFSVFMLLFNLNVYKYL